MKKKKKRCKKNLKEIERKEMNIGIILEEALEYRIYQRE
jgi:hypothetical protein